MLTWPDRDRSIRPVPSPLHRRCIWAAMAASPSGWMEWLREHWPDRVRSWSRAPPPAPSGKPAAAGSHAPPDRGSIWHESKEDTNEPMVEVRRGACGGGDDAGGGTRAEAAIDGARAGSFRQSGT